MDNSPVQNLAAFVASEQKSRSFSSAACLGRGWSESHNNLLSFLAVCQECHIDILPITWQQALGLSGEGGTAKIGQSQVNQEVSWAFKRWDWARFGPRWTDTTVSNMYNAFISEVWVLTRPAICENPNIVNLEGICWEFPQDRPVSPVLVFEKAHLGDLSHFLLSPEGHKLSFYERLHICRQIALAVLLLHRQHVIHGDIKPDNILMFSEKSTGLVPKITDFGYSTLASSGMEAISLATSEPWCAPEIHPRKFTFENAKLTDIFSLGMVSLWVLFSKELSGEPIQDDGIAHSSDNSLGDPLFRGRSILKELKKQAGLTGMAKELLQKSTSLSGNDRSSLVEFFSLTLEPNPLSRVCDLGILFSKLGAQSEQETRGLVKHPELFNELHPEFELSVSFETLMLADYRVRDQLFQDVLMQCGQSECQKCARIAKVAAAVFYQIGFGTTADLERSASWINKVGSSEELESKINLLRSKRDNVSYRNKRIKFFMNEAIVETLDHVEDTKSLDTYEMIYARQLSDMKGVLGDSHEVVYNLKRTLSLILNQRGDYKRAADLMIELVRDGDNDPEYGPNHPTTITMRNHLAATLLWLRFWQEAETYAKEAARCSSLSLGATHPLTLEALQVLTATFRLQGELENAKSLQTKIVKRKSKFFGPAHPRTLQAKSDLSEIYSAQGLWSTSQRLLEEVWMIAERDIGPDNPDSLKYMIQHATALRSVGRYSEAEITLLRAKSLTESVLGKDHFASIRASYVLATTYHAQGRLSEAEELQRLVLEQEIEKYGEGDVELLSTKAQIGQIYIDQHRAEEAEALLREVMEGSIAGMGDRHPETLGNIGKYATALAEQGQLDRAEELARATVTKCKKQFGTAHPSSIVNMSILAEILAAQAQYGEAETLWKAVITEERKLSGKRSPRTLHGLCHLAHTIYQQGNLRKAEELQRRTLRQCRNRFGPLNPCTFLAMRNLCKIYIKQGELDSAEALERRLIRRQLRNARDYELDIVCDVVDLILIYILKGKQTDAEDLQRLLTGRIDQMAGSTQVRALKNASRIQSLFLEAGMYEAAEKVTTDVMAQLTKLRGPDDPDVIKCMEDLSSSYFIHKRYAEAQELRIAVLGASRKVHGDEDLLTISRMRDLAVSNAMLGLFEEAEQLGTEATEACVQGYGKDVEDTVEAVADLGLIYALQGKWELVGNLEREFIRTASSKLNDSFPEDIARSAALAQLSSYKDLWGEPFKCVGIDNFEDLVKEVDQGPNDRPTS